MRCRAHFQPDAGFLLQRCNHAEQVLGGRIALPAEHPHQAFRRHAGCFRQRGKPDGRVYIIAEHGFGGVPVAFDRCLHRLPKQGLTKLRILRDPGFDEGLEVAREGHDGLYRAERVIAI